MIGKPEFFEKNFDLNAKPFNISDIRDCYQLTRITPSKNITQDLARLQKKGFLIPLPEEKEGKPTYKLSKEAIDYIRNLS